MISWPLALPYQPERRAWQAKPLRGPSETQMERGNVRQRREPGDVLGEYGWAREFSAAEFVEWEAFLASISDGADRWTMMVALHGSTFALREVSMVSGSLAYASGAGGRRRVSFRLRVWPDAGAAEPTIVTGAMWPAGLPWRSIRDKWGGSPVAPPLETDIEGGNVALAARLWSNVGTFDWGGIFSPEEMALWLDFLGSIGNGSARFYMPVEASGAPALRQVELVANSLAYGQAGDGYTSVDMKLRVYPPEFAPAAPAIVSVSGATISGTAPAGATVNVDIGGTVLTVVATGGTWSVQPLLVAGTYPARVTGSWNGFDWPWSSSQNVTLGLQAATSALIGRMTVAPGSARAALINKLVIDLTAAGLWAKLDALYVLAAHDAQAARLNWLSTSYALTAVNSPVFTVDRGYAGAGGAVYLATGFDPAAAPSPWYTQNSAHISAWSLSNFQQTGGLIGNGVANGDAHIYPWPADNKLYTQVNAATSDSIVLAASSGCFMASRLSATTHKVYRDGAAVATYTRASTAPASHAFVVGAGGPGTGYTTRQIAAATIGAGLTDAEAASLRTAMRDYLAGVNAIYSAEAVALFSRMTVQPTTARKDAIDALITGLVAAGIWPKLDALYLLAAHDAQAARLNWIANAYNLTAVNSPTFTVDRGYAGTGGVMYLDTGFNPATAAGAKFIQNSAHLSAYSLSAFQQSGGLIGNGFAANASHILPYAVDGAHYSSVNSAASNTFGQTTSQGLFVVSRQLAGSYKAFRNAAAYATHAQASGAPASENFVVGGRGAGGQFTTRLIAAASMGAGLTDAEVTAMNTLFNSYLATVGAVA